MFTHVEVIPGKTYATESNMLKAVEKVTSRKQGELANRNVRFYTAWTKDGRCFPVFVGAEAVNVGIHFHFNVIG